MNRFCPKCGTENTTNSKFCPNCGEQMNEGVVNNTVVASTGEKTNGLAVAGLVLGIISVIYGVFQIIYYANHPWSWYW